jgi:hypothetical protein
MFFFFLILSTLFWVLAKFSKETSATITASLNYIDLPEGTALSANNPEEVAFDISANGFEFLNYKFKTPTITVPVNRFAGDDASEAIIEELQLAKLINDQLKQDLSVQNLSMRGITVNLDAIISKQIPVSLTSEITYKEGFKSVGGLVITPDSVVISGPENLLLDFSSIATVNFSASELDSDFSEKIDLQLPTDELLQVEPQEVKVAIKVLEFTQKELTLPINIINLPAGVNIKLVPQTINISMDVAIDDFNSISAEDFHLVCDYAQRNMTENFLIPRILRKPASVQHIELTPKKIEFLIFK